MEMIDKAGTGSPVRIHADLVQGTDEWIAARCGLLTASEMSLIITPAKLQVARNEKQRAHLYELLAQRVSRYVEPHYVSDDMLRGHDDEQEALRLYALNYAPIEQVGFITNDMFGFTLGYSPDALVGDEGTVEVKSRRQRFQVETFILHVPNKSIPAEFLIQVQTGLMVSQRQWCDFLSYSGGLPMVPIRVYPDERVQSAIFEAAEEFEQCLAAAMAQYRAAVVASGAIATERLKRDEEITL